MRDRSLSADHNFQQRVLDRLAAGNLQPTFPSRASVKTDIRIAASL